ncbi:MAG: rhodanese-like domain-containing protein [Terracidiphilus sp.]
MLPYEIFPTDAAQVLRDRGARLIDVREPWEFAAARIEGSLLIPMREVPTRAQKELDLDERLIVVCHVGVRSMSATAWLRRQGFEKAQSLRGGIDAWSVEIDPSVPRY